MTAAFDVPRHGLSILPGDPSLFQAPVVRRAIQVVAPPPVVAAEELPPFGELALAKVKTRVITGGIAAAGVLAVSLISQLT